LEKIHTRIFGNQAKKPAPSSFPSTSLSLDDSDLIQKAKQAANGDKFSQLWTGDWSGYPSQSEADLALCSTLSFWTRRDPGQMDRLFRQSKLMRPKWDEKHFGDGRTYGQETISKAISGTTEAYSPGKPPQTKREANQFDTPIGAKLTKEKADQVVNGAPPPPDSGLSQTIMAILLPGKEKPPMMIRRSEAGKILLDWLNRNGGFVQSEDGNLYYFFRPQRRLYGLASERWAAWLYSLTAINPASTDFAYLSADCKTSAIFAPKRRILRFSAWDKDEKVLRVSRFDGTVYVLNGESVKEEPNGENALFLDDPIWTSYTPELNSTGNLHWLTTEFPNWEDERDSAGLVLMCWILSTFFSELCPTRPILVLLGDKGSGKSMLLRLILRLLFGPMIEISGVPDKPDGFTAAAAASHILAMDNLDEYTPWLRDKLASLSTGKMDEYRKLYTSNEVGRVFYRCWLTFTARTPETLRRDDLTDRLVILPLKRIDEWQAERAFLSRVDTERNQFWGDLFDHLNRIISEIKKGRLENSSNLRLADWESVCRIAANTDGLGFVWEAFVETLKQQQADFLLEGNLIVEGLDLWLDKSGNEGREVKAKQLFEELKAVLFNDNKPSPDWPKSAKSFGKQLLSLRYDLKRVFNIFWTRGRKKFWVYKFSKRDEDDQ
jgi:hypothetical protein